MQRFLFSTLVGLLCLLPASAEIKVETVMAYNKAVAGSDASAARSAASALAAEAVANPEDAASATIAFETSWMLCKLGACSEALPAARLAGGAPDAASEIEGVTRRLLAAYVDWKIKPDRVNTKAFDTALFAVTPAQASALSVSAFNERFAAAVKDDQLKQAEDIAEAALTHFSSAGPDAQQFAAEARLGFTSLQFYSRPKRDAVEQMIRLKGEMQRLRRLSGDEAPAWTEKVYWTAEAWTLAMDAYFKSVGQSGVSEKRHAAIMAEYTQDLPAEIDPTESGEGTDDGVRTCKGRLDMTPMLRYPAGAAARGQFGSVIVRFKLVEGAVAEPEILAAVPSEGFRAEALKTVSKWRYVPSEEPASAGCDLNNMNNVLPLVFALG